MAAFYTLVYVAPIKDAETIAIDADEDAMDRYPSAWLRLIGDQELVALWGILSSETKRETLFASLVYESPGGEMLVTQFPEPFVVAVDRLPIDDLEHVALEWNATELMQDWSLADVLTVLGELQAICKQSSECGLPVLQVSGV